MEDTTNEAEKSTGQYSIRTILWSTTAAALLLAYVQRLDWPAAQLMWACVVMWIGSSLIFGLLSRRPKEVLYWAGLITVEAFLAVTAVRAFGYSQSAGWGLVGALCGGFCATQLVTHPMWGSLMSGLLGALAMIGTLKFFGEKMDMERWLDLFGAGAAGWALWHFVEFMRWFLATSRQSPAVLAAWLTLSVLAGNWAVRWLGY